MGVKEVLKYMEQEDVKIQALRRKFEILLGYLANVVGRLDTEHPKHNLNTLLREGGGLIEPLSTNVICGGDGGVSSGPYNYGGICIYSFCWDSLVGIFTILPPINFFPTSMKSKSEILKML
jgi:hypothetical protein